MSTWENIGSKIKVLCQFKNLRNGKFPHDSFNSKFSSSIWECVILFRRPGGASKYPRSGYFLVDEITQLASFITIHCQKRQLEYKKN